MLFITFEREGSKRKYPGGLMFRLTYACEIQCISIFFFLNQSTLKELCYLQHMPTCMELSVRSVWFLSTILSLSLLTLSRNCWDDRKKIIKSCFEVSYLNCILSIGFRSSEYSWDRFNARYIGHSVLLQCCTDYCR